MYKLFWLREDKQGDYAMGTFASFADAKAAVPAALAEIIDQCPGPATETNEDFVKCRDEVLAGSWVVQEISDDGDVVKTHVI